MADAENNATLGKAWAARLGIALLAGFTAIAIFTSVDHARRHSLEQIEEPTAVGDRHFVNPSAQPPLTFQGTQLVGKQKVERRDSQMMKAGTDDSGGFFVYESEDAKDSGALFLKVANDEYLKVPAR